MAMSPHFFKKVCELSFFYMHWKLRKVEDCLQVHKIENIFKYLFGLFIVFWFFYNNYILLCKKIKTKALKIIKRRFGFAKEVLFMNILQGEVWYYWNRFEFPRNVLYLFDILTCIKYYLYIDIKKSNFSFFLFLGGALMNIYRFVLLSLSPLFFHFLFHI